jgi:hypothetical protein
VFNQKAIVRSAKLEFVNVTSFEDALHTQGNGP